MYVLQNWYNEKGGTECIQLTTDYVSIVVRITKHPIVNKCSVLKDAKINFMLNMDIE